MSSTEASVMAELDTTSVGDEGGPVYSLDPKAAGIRELINWLYLNSDAHGTYRVLANRSAANAAMDNFLVAARASELIRDGRVVIRTGDSKGFDNIMVSSESIEVLVTGVGKGFRGGEESASETVDVLEEWWDKAEEYDVRTPPLDEVCDTLPDRVGDGDGLGEATRETLESMIEVYNTLAIEAAGEAGGVGGLEGVNEVSLSLLAAASEQVLFYDISRWGEDIRVASKATFSRVKNQMEEEGLIETTKVPVNVGRPRQRLLLTDDVADEDVVSLVRTANERLAP